MKLIQAHTWNRWKSAVLLGHLVSLLSGCVLHPEYLNAITVADSLLHQAREEIDTEQYQTAIDTLQQTMPVIEEAWTYSAGVASWEGNVGRLGNERNQLLLEAYAGSDQIDAAVEKVSSFVSNDEPLLQLQTQARNILVNSMAGNDGQAIVEVRALLYPLPTAEEMSAAVKANISDEFGEAYFGGGDYSVYLPPEWTDNDHPNADLAITLAVTVLRRNPGSTEAIRFLNSRKDFLRNMDPAKHDWRRYGATRAGLSLCISTVERQMESGSFTGEGLALAKRFLTPFGS